METAKTNIRKHQYILLYFTIYSCIGWCIETIYMSIQLGRLAQRGFLFGPLCPIYGFGALLLILLLSSIKNRLILFLAGTFITTFVEFAVSVLLEALFQKSWWDYSNEFLNIQGRVCLKFSLCWGVSAVILIQYIHPWVEHYLVRIPSHHLPSIAILILVYLLADTSLSTLQILKIQYSSQPVQSILEDLKEKIVNTGDLPIPLLNDAKSRWDDVRRKYRTWLDQIFFQQIELPSSSFILLPKLLYIR